MLGFELWPSKWDTRKALVFLVKNHFEAGLVECLPRVSGYSQYHIVVQACHPSTLEADAGGSGGQSPHLHSKFQNSLGYNESLSQENDQCRNLS